MRLFPTLRNLTGEKPIALQDFLGNLKDTFENCSLCEGEPVQGFAYLLSDNAIDLDEVYNGNEMRTNAFHYHERWPVIINAMF